jgi:tricorn protease-like protein
MKKLLLVLLLLILAGCVKEEIPDTDGDGWDDAQEARAGTDPTKVDTDGDGLWDPLDPNPLDPEIPGTKEEKPERVQEEVVEPVPETPQPTPPPETPAMPPAEQPELSYLELVQTSSPELVAEVNLGEQVSDLAASEKYVAAAAEKGFYLFDFRGEQLFFYPTQAEPKHVALSPEGVLYGTTEAWEGMMYAISGGSLLWKRPTEGVVEELVLSGNGKVIAYSSYRKIYLLDAEKGVPLEVIKTDVSIASFALSWDASYIAVAGKGGTVSLYSREGELLWRWEGYTYRVDILSVAVDSRGEYVAAGTNYYRILVFSSASPRFPREIKTGAEVIKVFAAPDDSYLAAVSYDKNIYYFSSEGEVKLRRSYDRIYSKIAVSPAGGYATADNSIRHLYFFK